MYLVVDIGNTSVKAAVFQNNSLTEKISFPREKFFEKISDFLRKFPSVDHSILSSVVKEVSQELEFLQKHTSVVLLDNHTRLPFKNHYATPKTLGKDRIALTAAACLQYPGENVLVIDAGTCVTYDFKSEREEYLGGAISPGLSMRFRALHEFTSKLPLVAPEEKTELEGSSTEESINTGVLMGLRLEIDGMIDSYREKKKFLTVILTGGDMQILSVRLKNSIFANPNFLLSGLNYILEFNKTQ
ncbi:MAG: type III pantothenate kinase [Salegentibacter sp.]